MIEQRLAELVGLPWDVIAVWGAAPALAVFWVELVKHKSKRKGQPIDDLTLIAMDSTLGFVLSTFAAFALFAWPLKQAISHGIAVGVALPLLCIVIFRLTAKHAPDIADDLGFDAVPTQYRIDDDKTEPKP